MNEQQKKQMAQAMLVAERCTEARMTAYDAKTSANNLLHAGVNLTDEEKDKLREFMDFCQSLIERNSHWEAKKYVEGLNNG